MTVQLIPPVVKVASGARSGATTMQNAATATGNGTSLDVSGQTTAVLEITGTFTAVVSFEGSEDDSAWYPLSARSLGANTIATTATSPGLYQLGVAGLKSVRARVTWTSGTSVTVKGYTIPFAAQQAATNVNLVERLAGEDIPADVLGTIFKPVISSAYSPSRYSDAGSVTKGNIKSAPGVVLSFRITNANAAIRYFQLHNKATAPSASETPQMVFQVPAGSATVPAVVEIGSQFLAPQEYFSTGIGWAISTTESTFTDSATASEHRARVSYV